MLLNLSILFVKSKKVYLQYCSTAFFSPKKYYEYERDVTTKYAQSFIDSTNVDKLEFNEQIIKNYDYVPMPLCPNCESRYPNKRIRKIPQYLCTECRHEFDEPIYKPADELIATFYEYPVAAEVCDKCFVSKDK